MANLSVFEKIAPFTYSRECILVDDQYNITIRQGASGNEDVSRKPMGLTEIQNKEAPITHLEFYLLSLYQYLLSGAQLVDEESEESVLKGYKEVNKFMISPELLLQEDLEHVLDQFKQLDSVYLLILQSKASVYFITDLENEYKTTGKVVDLSTIMAELGENADALVPALTAQLVLLFDRVVKYRLNYDVNSIKVDTISLRCWLDGALYGQVANNGQLNVQDDASLVGIISSCLGIIEGQQSNKSKFIKEFAEQVKTCRDLHSLRTVLHDHLTKECLKCGRKFQSWAVAAQNKCKVCFAQQVTLVQLEGLPQDLQDNPLSAAFEQSFLDGIVISRDLCFGWTDEEKRTCLIRAAQENKYPEAELLAQLEAAYNFREQSVLSIVIDNDHLDNQWFTLLSRYYNQIQSLSGTQWNKVEGKQVVSSKIQLAYSKIAREKEQKQVIKAEKAKYAAERQEKRQQDKKAAEEAKLKAKDDKIALRAKKSLESAQRKAEYKERQQQQKAQRKASLQAAQQQAQGNGEAAQPTAGGNRVEAQQLTGEGGAGFQQVGSEPGAIQSHDEALLKEALPVEADSSQNEIDEELEEINEIITFLKAKVLSKAFVHKPIQWLREKEASALNTLPQRAKTLLEIVAQKDFTFKVLADDNTTISNTKVLATVSGACQYVVITDKASAQSILGKVYIDHIMQFWSQLKAEEKPIQQMTLAKYINALQQLYLNIGCVQITKEVTQLAELIRPSNNIFQQKQYGLELYECIKPLKILLDTYKYNSDQSQRKQKFKVVLNGYSLLQHAFMSTCPEWKVQTGQQMCASVYNPAFNAEHFSAIRQIINLNVLAFADANGWLNEDSIKMYERLKETVQTNFNYHLKVADYFLDKRHYAKMTTDFDYGVDCTVLTFSCSTTDIQLDSGDFYQFKTDDKTEKQRKNRFAFCKNYVKYTVDGVINSIIVTKLIDVVNLLASIYGTEAEYKMFVQFFSTKEFQSCYMMPIRFGNEETKCPCVVQNMFSQEELHTSFAERKIQMLTLTSLNNLIHSKITNQNVQRNKESFELFNSIVGQTIVPTVLADGPLQEETFSCKQYQNIQDIQDQLLSLCFMSINDVAELYNAAFEKIDNKVYKQKVLQLFDVYFRQVIKKQIQKMQLANRDMKEDETVIMAFVALCSADFASGFDTKLNGHQTAFHPVMCRVFLPRLLEEANSGCYKKVSALVKSQQNMETLTKALLAVAESAGTYGRATSYAKGKEAISNYYSETFKK